MGLSIEEQETHVNFSRGDERAEVYASDTTMITKLDKLVRMEGTEWRLERLSKIKEEVVGKTYSCPVSFISFRSKRVSRDYTDEQREAMANRMRMMHSSNSN